MADHKKAHNVTSTFNDSIDDVFFSEKELARRHRRNAKTLRNDRVLGRGVPFHIFGRLVRYRFSDMLAYEQAARVACADSKMGKCSTSSADPRAETFLTPHELGKRHQREEKTLRNDRVQRRYISFYKRGGQVRYAMSDILAYEHAHRVTSTTEA